MLRDLILPYALADAKLGDDVLEVGPGPGMTTDLLRAELPRAHRVEVDEDLAASLAARSRDQREGGPRRRHRAPRSTGERFTGAVSFTMLHHVPTPELQDRLFA